MYQKKLSEVTQCPEADFVINGQAFKSYLDSPKSFVQAHETCRVLEGSLPMIKTEDEFLTTRIVAGNCEA